MPRLCPDSAPAPPEPQVGRMPILLGDGSKRRVALVRSLQYISLLPEAMPLARWCEAACGFGNYSSWSSRINISIISGRQRKLVRMSRPYASARSSSPRSAASWSTRSVPITRKPLLRASLTAVRSSISRRSAPSEVARVRAAFSPSSRLCNSTSNDLPRSGCTSNQPGGMLVQARTTSGASAWVNSSRTVEGMFTLSNRAGRTLKCPIKTR